LNRKLTLALLTIGHSAEHWYLGVMGPVLPFLVADLNISLTQVGLLFAGRSVFSALSSAGTGYVTDRLGGGKWLLVVSLAGIAIVYGAMSLTTGFLTLLPLFWLSGLISHLWHPPSMGLLGNLFSDRRGFALGFHGTGANIGQTLAPLAAGYILLSMSWRGTFAVNMLPVLLAAFLLAIFLSPFNLNKSKSKETASTSTSFIQPLFTNPLLGATALIAGSLTVGHHGLITFLPILLVSKYAASPEWVGICLSLYAASAIIPETFVGYVSDRISRKFVLISGLIIGGVSMLAIPSLAAGPYVLIPLITIGIFLRSLRPVIFAHALDVAPPHLKGSTVGLLFTTNQCFSGVGPLIAGMLSDIYGVDMAIWFFGSLTLAILPLFAFLPQFTQKVGEDTTAAIEGESSA
jgi:MFS transporter, FSR family, fosmidomycin resistance protein